MAERRRHKKRIQVARWSPGTGGDSGVLGRGTTGGDVPSGREAVSAGSRRRDGLEAGRCWRPLGRGGLRSGRVRRRGAALESRVQPRVPAAEGPGLRGEGASLLRSAGAKRRPLPRPPPSLLGRSRHEGRGNWAGRRADPRLRRRFFVLSRRPVSWPEPGLRAPARC